MSGGAKPKKAKVTPAKSAYGKINEASFEGPFGGATSQLTPYTYTDPLTGKNSTRTKVDTNLSLSQPLQQAGDTAATGLNNNLAYLQRDPNQRIDYLRSGQDPTFAITNELAQRKYDQDLGRLRLNAQQTGSSNSTAAGAAYGQLMRDKGLVDNQNLLAALNYGNENARADAGLNLGTIGGLAQLVYPLGSAANAQLNTGLGSLDRAAAANAQAMNQASLQYAAEDNAYRQRQQAALWSAIGGTLSGGLSGGFSAYGGSLSGQPSGGGQSGGGGMGSMGSMFSGSSAGGGSGGGGFGGLGDFETNSSMMIA